MEAVDVLPPAQLAHLAPRTPDHAIAGGPLPQVVTEWLDLGLASHS